MEDSTKTKVYIKVDNNSNVVDINSSIFVKDPDDHAQSSYLNKPLINEDGTYNYKFINDEIIEIV